MPEKEGTPMFDRSASRRLRRGVAAVLLALGFAVGATAVAGALPPDGPGPETPGTSSKVWPKEVKAGDRLNFEVSGYPANETVYIKIDDGAACSDTSHGACVYHTQKLDKNGYAKGSLVVPDLGTGAHWLRMLATGDVFDAKTGEKLGYEGYTRRGGNDFTVVAGGSSTKKADGSTVVEGGGTTSSDGKIEGGSVDIALGEEDASPAPSESASAAPSESAPASPEPAATPAATGDVAAPAASPSAVAAPAAVTAPPAAGGGVPVVGIAALGGAVLLGGAGIGWALARRNRLVKAAAAGSAE
jgi:hypothetical protein